MPSGSSPGKCCLAIASLMMTTGGFDASSVLAEISAAPQTRLERGEIAGADLAILRLVVLAVIRPSDDADPHRCSRRRGAPCSRRQRIERRAGLGEIADDPSLQRRPAAVRWNSSTPGPQPSGWPAGRRAIRRRRAADDRDSAPAGRRRRAEPSPLRARGRPVGADASPGIAGGIRGFPRPAWRAAGERQVQHRHNGEQRPRTARRRGKARNPRFSPRSRRYGMRAMRFGRDERTQQLHRPRGERHAGDGTERHEHQAFGHELPHHARP